MSPGQLAHSPSTRYYYRVPHDSSHRIETRDHPGSLLALRPWAASREEEMFASNRQRKRPARHRSWPLQTVDQSLGVSAQSLDALGAQVLAHSPAAFSDGDTLNIGPELPLGSHVRVADTVPKTGRLAATFAFSHCYYPQVQSPAGKVCNVKATSFRSPGKVYHIRSVSARPPRRSYVK